MKDKLYSLDKAKEIILTGKPLIISGHEKLLEQLPKGNWLGATISRFLDVEGGVIDNSKVFVNDISPEIEDFKFSTYDETTITDVVKERYDNGFSYILLPLFSKVHAEFGIKAFDMENLYENPLVGWVSGIEEGEYEPYVFLGSEGLKTKDRAVVMHCKLPDSKIARLEIINVFEQGDGDEIEFFENSFEIKDCLINGEKRNLTDYWLSNDIDERLPLVANFSGAHINVHPLAIDEKNKIIQMAASVFPGFKYRLAKPLDDFISTFKSKVPRDDSKIVSCINCHANFEFLKLEGEKLGTLKSPFSFGEIGYVLLNQTMVNLYVENA